MNKSLNNEKGITLVSLIITIIILLILAGITLINLIGENGLLNRADTAKKAYEISAIKEAMQIELADMEMEAITKGNGIVTGTILREVIRKHGGELEADNETIRLQDYELKLSEIWKGNVDFSK